MKPKNENPLSADLPAEIREYLKAVPALSPEELEELRQAGEALDRDPAFRADYLKSLFVEKMLEAMAELGQSQSDLARRWKRSRQYISKLFNEDKRVNFTIETLCNMAHLLNRRVDIQVLREGEECCVVRSAPANRKIEGLESLWAKSISPTRRLPLNDAPVLFGEYRPESTSIKGNFHELADPLVK